MNHITEKLIIKYFIQFIREGHGSALAKVMTKKKTDATIKETVFVISSSTEAKDAVQQRNLERQAWRKRAL